MPKLRKMLGDIHSPECLALMRLIETQSHKTLAAWAVDYAKTNYLDLYAAESPADLRLKDAVFACEEYLAGARKLQEIKPVLKDAAQAARDAALNSVAQAAARAVSTACATVQTPTNALGFLFYGAAATAYSQAGLTETTEIYDGLAARELQKAYDALRQAAVPNEPHPAKINWNC